MRFEELEQNLRQRQEALTRDYNLYIQRFLKEKVDRITNDELNGEIANGILRDKKLVMELPIKFVSENEANIHKNQYEVLYMPEWRYGTKKDEVLEKIKEHAEAVFEGTCTVSMEVKSTEQITEKKAAEQSMTLQLVFTKKE